MLRLAWLLFAAAGAQAAIPSVDIDTAAMIYRDAAIREQVRASLPTMPAQIRKLFTTDPAVQMSEPQLAAVTAAAERGFRIDVFEAPALSALAANLDASTVKKTEAFLSSDLGKRMVAADVALATLDQADIDKVMNGDLVAASTPQRDALFDKLEAAARSTESTVEIFLSMGSAVAIGTAVGSGADPAATEQRAQKSGDTSRHALEQDMREPLRRYMAYGYRDLSDADLKHLLGFLQSAPGKHYVAAYIASMEAGFGAMGRRCGEQLGESLRELAQAQAAAPSASTLGVDAPGVDAPGVDAPGLDKPGAGTPAGAAPAAVPAHHK